MFKESFCQMIYIVPAIMDNILVSYMFYHCIADVGMVLRNIVY